MASSAESGKHSTQPKRRPWGWVVHDPPAPDSRPVIDWEQWYLTEEDDMGESPDQNDIIKLLVSCLTELARTRRWSNLRIASDSFFQWVPAHPAVQVSPDVYIMDEPPAQTGPEPRRRSFQTWLPGIHPPRLALEIVSLDKRKDMDDAPARYAHLGCRELIIFDPLVKPRSRRPMLTVYGRDEDGAFVKRPSGAGPVYSTEADAWFVPVRRADGLHCLRVATDPAGREIVATEWERADQEARRAEEAERRASMLEAEIARLRKKK